MNFGQAIEALKQGKKVARAGWNGKGMYVFMEEGYDTNGYKFITRIPRSYCPPHLCMKAADGTIVVGWLASQTDMLAEDWEIVEYTSTL